MGSAKVLVSFRHQANPKPSVKMVSLLWFFRVSYELLSAKSVSGPGISIVMAIFTVSWYIGISSGLYFKQDGGHSVFCNDTII